MFFFLSKVFSFLISPFTWIGVLLLMAVLVKKPGLSKKLIISAFIVFFLAGNRFLADEMIRCWELPITPENQLKPCYDMGILLGGGIVQEDKKTGRLIFRNNTDRLFQTIQLYKSGKIKNIMISGGPGDLYLRDIKEGSLMRKYLLTIGIPDSVILVDSVSDNTHENAVICASILKTTNAGRSNLLITSSFHMRRAAACFKKEGIQCDIFTTNKITGPRRWNIRHLLIPDISGIIIFQNFLHEITGYIVYKFAGYL